MEMGKLLLWGMVGFILLDLWSGNEPARQSIAEDTDASVVEMPAMAALPPTTQVTSAAVLRAVTPDSEYELEPDFSREDEYKSYATYEYIRPRDTGTQNTYTYRVDGRDEDGDRVRGMVNTRGRFGNGYLRTEKRELIWIETEWTDDGELVGYDESGTCYELETDEVR